MNHYSKNLKLNIFNPKVDFLHIAKLHTFAPINKLQY